MRHFEGDLFTTDNRAIGHGVNTKGVMGAGIAVPIKEKWPNNFARYAYACKNYKLFPGNTLVSTEADGHTIFNIASQDKPGAHASYKWLFDAGKDAIKKAQDVGIDSIAIPEIGCGIGGLEWKEVGAVLRTLELYFDDNFEWEVWHYA